MTERECIRCGSGGGPQPCVNEQGLCCLCQPRPATRVGRTVMFKGGRTVRLSLWAWALFALGLRRSL